MAENVPQIHQRFVHGVQRHGHILDDLERAEENARHARKVGGRSFSLPLAVLAVIAVVAIVAVFFLIYQITGAADAVPSTPP